MYYLRENGKIHGPFTAERMKELAASGRISRQTEVSDDRTVWKLADCYSELFPEKKHAAPPSLPKTPKIASKEPKVEEKNAEPEVIRLDLPDFTRPARDVKVSPPDPPDMELPRESAFRKLLFLEIAWDPMESIPEIYSALGDNGALKTGIALIVLSALSVFAALELAARSGNLGINAGHFGMAFFSFISLGGLLVSCFIVRKFLGEKGEGGSGGDCLTAGSGAILLSIALLISALTAWDGAFFQRFGAIISAGAVLYAACSMVFCIFTGCTRISRIPRSVGPVAVPLIIAATAITAGLAAKFLL